MKRRLFLGMPFVLTGIAQAEEKPWVARVLKGGFDGKYWWMGFGVKLAPGWKTYWRVPGDGGIAPEIKLVGLNLKSYEVLYPLPKRFEDAAGVTIGYKEDVVFPIRVEPENAADGIQLQFNSFIGVCDVVCIPAQTTLELFFDPKQPDMRDQAEISQWQVKVPALNGTVVNAAQAAMSDSKVILKLTLSEPVNDVFVEGQALHFFGKPTFNGNMVELIVNGAKSATELSGKALRMTLDVKGKGLEQTVTVV
jgi:DsbC/DsbD-like thiol-disulfide interchange protein